MEQALNLLFDAQVFDVNALLKCAIDIRDFVLKEANGSQTGNIN